MPTASPGRVERSPSQNQRSSKRHPALSLLPQRVLCGWFSLECSILTAMSTCNYERGAFHPTSTQQSARSLCEIFSRIERALRHMDFQVMPTENRFPRSEEHTSELQSLMRISYAVFCLKKKTIQQYTSNKTHT